MAGWQHASPLMLFSPSLAIMGVMASPATGSAHHQPKTAFNISPTSRIADKHTQKSVCFASATIAALPNSLPTFFLAWERMGMTTSETHARTMPGKLCSAVFLARRSETPSYVTYTARAMKQAPTILILSRSFLSRLPSSASTDILHSRVAPEVTSIKLSIPNPTSEMLPAIAPAITATRPSRLFQAMVKYSSRFPRRASVLRVVTNSVTTRAYQSHTKVSSSVV